MKFKEVQQQKSNEKQLVKDFLKKYPNKEKFLKAQKGTTYKDSMGRTTKHTGQDHEIRQDNFYYDLMTSKK